MVNEKVVFTIVAKNYLPLARALSWSIKEYSVTPVTFIVFLADEPDETINLDNPDEIIIPVSSLGITGLTDWAFKYNVTEFCTSVKPSCFKYVFNNLKAEKAIYFDPDIFVFNDLGTIFKDLEYKEIVVTPHYITPQIHYTGNQKESDTLFVGIYNFGFVAFKNTPNNLFILNWWENRLSNQCYADRQESLHTDQRWADFLPVYAYDTLLISKSTGYNLAPWNLFEREIFKDQNTFFVKNRLTHKTEPLIFVHFAGYDPNDLNLIHKDFWDMKISEYPDYSFVRDIYTEITNKFKFNELRKSDYTYNMFSNGDPVLDHHRRLYRALTDNGDIISDPFLKDGSYYNMLLMYGLISKNKPTKQNRKTYANFDTKLKKINKIFKIVFKILGSERYFLLMKLLNRYSKPENQSFLINKKVNKIY